MNTEYKNKKIYYPMLVSKFNNRDDKKDEFLLLWRQFDALPQNVRNLMSSEKLVDFIYGISQHFNLDEMRTEEFSRTIRRYFFGEIADGQFARIIGDLCHTSNEEGLAILNSIKNIRVETEMRRNLVTGELQPVPSAPLIPPTTTNYYSSQNQRVFQAKTKPVAIPNNLMKIPIKRALKLFPKLETQIFTETEIFSKKYLKPIKPTIKNWLVVYEDFTGAGKKSAIDRGNFLFQADVCRNLTTEEKQKLANLLKSVDEDFPLFVDGNKAQVVFPNFPQNNSFPESSNSNNSSNSENFENSEEKNEPVNQMEEENFEEIPENNENNFSNFYDENKEDLTTFPKKDNFTEENVNQSVQNFNSQNYNSNLNLDQNQNNYSNPNNFSDNSQQNLNSNFEDKFNSGSDFNSKAFSSLSNADFSQSNLSPKNPEPKFSINYSMDDLNNKTNLANSFPPTQANNFEDLSFGLNSKSKNSNFNSDEGSLSFTSNHILPVEKSFLEKNKSE
jgi:hypothetical protein